MPQETEQERARKFRSQENIGAVKMQTVGDRAGSEVSGALNSV